jgi:hypothetical protein
MLSVCKLVERFNRQDAWTVGAGSIQLRQVRIVETAHLTSLRLWVGRVVKILTSAISSSILCVSWGWSSPISAAKADGSCYARATSPAVVGAKLEHPAIGGSLSPREDRGRRCEFLSGY